MERVEEIRKNTNTFKLIEKDLYRNRFEPITSVNASKLGHLKLFNSFLNSEEDIISHAIIGSNEIKILNLNTGASRIWPSMEVKCAVLYERTKLICGCYTSSCLFRDNYVIDNSIKMLDLKTGKCLQKFRGHADLVMCLRVLTNSKNQVKFFLQFLSEFLDNLNFKN